MNGASNGLDIAHIIVYLRSFIFFAGRQGMQSSCQFVADWRLSLKVSIISDESCAQKGSHEKEVISNNYNR